MTITCIYIYTTQLHARQTSNQEVMGSIPPVLTNPFFEIDHEIFSNAILKLPLIHEAKKKNLHLVLVNRYVGLSLPRKNVLC